MWMPGAVPWGLAIGWLPRGNWAWSAFRSGIERVRRAKSWRMWARAASSWTRSTPVAAAMASRVRSSAVGPRPPVATTKSARSIAARKTATLFVEVVADGGVESDVDAQLGEPLAEPLAIGVQPLAGGELVANGNDFGVHGGGAGGLGLGAGDDGNSFSLGGRSSPRGQVR